MGGEQQNDRLEREVEQQLGLAFQHLPMRSMELTHGRYTLDNLLQHADYQLLAWKDLEHGLHSWARLFTLLASGIIISIRPHGSGMVMRLESDSPLPLWLLHMLRAVDLRLQRFAATLPSSEQHPWHWDWVLRNCWQEAQGLGITRCERGVHNQLVICHQLKLQAYPDVLPRVPNLLDYYRRQLLKDPGPSLNLVERCKRLMSRALPSVLQVDSLASELGISGRSLQRQLKLAGVSYSSLLTEVRQSQARAKLADTNISVRRLALELGFSEPSNFIRAFRQFEGCSPSDYRQQVKQHQVAPDHLPIRFLYAENLLQTDWRNSRRGARVWMEVRNITFTKDVSVMCEDLDGIWRGYPASFERWLGPGRELWSSVNISVFDPLRFRLQFRSGNRLYIDDNDGSGYTVSATQRYLLGDHELAVLSLELFTLADGQQLLTGRALTPRYGDDELHLVVSSHDWISGHTQRADTFPLEASDAIGWQFTLSLPTGAAPWVRFEHHSQLGVEVDDNAGEGYRPRNC
ncbi:MULTISPECIES: helix-turn-helix transcriptional regulator [Corallincola]|uniref:AraC family transcriptional regulator n=3 Tax=Corallincola TaxID=1775176 RepID=A0A368NNA2_9GAMM|nr:MULTISPECIES: AraC family transcriptional regulator [Corallincola]RCU51570.1 AraC family transcriptional regulator [Corallincola holothuriorum]TAA47073.1 AraC family transcriptional regulator [Corallincola spongiicola]TCI04724.1 AraC family transcriptional regulator [Corallincola luteus]